MKNNTTKQHQYIVFITQLRRFHHLSSDNKYYIGELARIKYNRRIYNSSICHIIK